MFSSIRVCLHYASLLSCIASLITLPSCCSWGLFTAGTITQEFCCCSITPKCKECFYSSSLLPVPL